MQKQSTNPQMPGLQSTKKQILSPTATTLRSGQWQDLSAEDLVPGDIVKLQAGAKVPADIRLLSSKNLRID